MSRKISLVVLVFLFLNPVFGNDSDNNLVIEKIEPKDLIAQNNLSIVSEEILKKNDSNRYGFLALWQQSDWVARGALIILLIMSLGSWTIFFSKFFEQSKIKRECNIVGQFSGQGKTANQIFTAVPKSSLLNIVYSAGQEAKIQTDSLIESIDPVNWVSDGIQNGINKVNGNLQNGLTFLATVGSTAPFVGLFGTVWAIYHALIKIGDSGQASLDKVAGPVGEALIMTAIGLAVAVPAVLGYNWLVRRNKILMESVTNFGNILYISFFIKR
jgi:biopolymer transport protein ExbB